MTSRVLRRTAALATALLLSACSGGAGPSPSPSEGPSATSETTQACDSAVSGIVTVVQGYVDQYAPAESSDGPAQKAPNLPRELKQAQSQLVSLGCEPQKTAERLSLGLDGVEAEGPLAQAVKRQLVASLTGTVGTSPTTQRVGSEDDLREVLPTLAPGSTVRLAAGRHRLPDTVVLLQGVRLVGAGRSATTLVSDASDAALLALTPSRVDLRALTVRHVGPRPASLVVGSASTKLVLRGVAMIGAKLAPQTKSKGEQSPANGGSGVLLAGEASVDGRAATSLEVTDSEFRDNDAAGILLSGRHVASVRGSRFLGNGQCGVCFTADSSGEVRDSRFVGGVTGLIAAGTAAPLVLDSSVRGAEIGVQSVDRASPVLRRTRVADASRVALLFGDRTRGRLESVSCTSSRFDIVVAPKALPYIGKTDCRVQPTG